MSRSPLLWPMFIMCGPLWAAPLPELVLNDANGPPFTNAQQTGFLDRVGQEAFRRAGLRLRLVQLPAERGLKNANDGIEDGDLTRIAGIDKTYPNLQRVPEKLIDWRFAAFTHRRDLAIPVNWKSLLSHNVGVIRGWKIAETNLATAKNLVLVNDVDQLFGLLNRQRVDAVVYSQEMGLWLLREQGRKDIRMLDPPLASREMFIYLNKKHARHIAPLAAALRSVKQDGTYDRLYRESMPATLGPAP